MCRKFQAVCSHCLMPQQELWDFCDYFQLELRYVVNQNERLDAPDEPPLELPDPVKCWCFSGSKIQIPVLVGCEKYDCPSWSYTENIGDADGAKDSQPSAAMAREIFERNKKKFARENFVRQPIPRRKEPVSFIMMAQRSIESTLESDSDDDSGDHTIPTTIQKKPQHRPGHCRVSRVLPSREAGDKNPASVSSRGSKRDSLSSQSLVVSSTPASSITPTATMVTDKAKDSDEEGGNSKNSRPARFANFHLIPTTAVAKYNAVVTFRLLKAPRSLEWVTSVEICNEPRPRTAELPEGVIKKFDIPNRCFQASRVFGAARNLVSRMF